MKMMRTLWNFDQELEDFVYGEEEISCLQNFIGSPPPPYSTEDLLNSVSKQKPNDRRLSYNDVGAEIYVTINKKPNEEIGLTILNGEAFNPSWPTILDIKKGTPASNAAEKLLIGDQIKELYGIPTETLKHSQVIALFSKATDQVTMTLRRGIEPSDRSFDWYKYPFSSVHHVYEEVSIQEESCDNANIDVCCPDCPETEQNEPVLFTSFKFENESQETNKFAALQYTTPNGIRRVRSFSDAYGRKSCAARQRQRRKTTDHTNNKSDPFRKFDLVLRRLPSNDGKFIADEIEKLELEEEENAFSPRHSGSNSRSDSRSSLSSVLSESTVSSFSSTSTSTTNERGLCSRLQCHWREQINQPTDGHNTSNGSIEVLAPEKLRNLTKSPAQILRNSIRRRKSEKDSIEALNEAGKSEASENTHSLTVWIADRKRVGLRLGGGSVSPYGDNNMIVRDVKTSSAAAKVFKVGDEILEIDSISTNGMDVHEADRMLSKLEGNFVEFKIFRPIKKM